MKEKNGEGRSSRNKEKRKHQRIFKSVNLNVKASNNSITHCVHYTGHCSIMHLLNTQCNKTTIIAPPSWNSSLWMWTDSLYIQQWHCGKPHCVSVWPGPSMYGPPCFLQTPSSTVTWAQLLIQPLQLHHTEASSLCSWILTEVCMCDYVWACLFYVCVQHVLLAS